MCQNQQFILFIPFEQSTSPEEIWWTSWETASCPFSCDLSASLDALWSFFLFILAFLELPIRKDFYFAHLSTMITEKWGVYVATTLWAVKHIKENALNSIIHTFHPFWAALIPRRQMTNLILVSLPHFQQLPALFWWTNVLLSLSLSFLGLTYKKRGETQWSSVMFTLKLQ